MTAERPTDIVLTEVEVTSVEVAQEDHGTITQDGDQLVAEAAADLTVLKDGRTQTQLSLGDAQLVVTYNRESEESAERAAVLLMGAPQLVTEVEQAYDAAQEDLG